jgi:hypothetical protein
MPMAEIVGFVIARAITVYTAVFAARGTNRADSLTQQIANEMEVPRIEQVPLRLRGRRTEVSAVRQKGHLVEGFPNPEFAATNLGKQIIYQPERNRHLPAARQANN